LFITHTEEKWKKDDRQKNQKPRPDLARFLISAGGHGELTVNNAGEDNVGASISKKKATMQEGNGLFW